MELYSILQEELNDDGLGRALDAVAPYIEDIEEAIVLSVLSRFGKIDTDQILWDTTSFYFEGDYEESKMITYGYNRDQKKDKKQAVVELNVTAKEGVPVCHRTLSGNASDQKEAIKNLETLRKRLKKKGFLVIGDRAMFTRENLAGLIGKELDFVEPLASKDKEFILGFPEDQFESLPYTTAKDKGGYSGIDTTYKFEHDSAYHTRRAVVVKNEELLSSSAKHSRGISAMRICKRSRAISMNVNTRKLTYPARD
jgi:transposase